MFPQSCVNLSVTDVFRLSSIVCCIVHHHLSLLDPRRVGPTYKIRAVVSYLVIYHFIHFPSPSPSYPSIPSLPLPFSLPPPKAPSQSSVNQPSYLPRLYHIIPLCYSKDTPPLRLSPIIPRLTFSSAPNSLLPPCFP